MKLYVSDIEEQYKDIIIKNSLNSGTEDLLLHIVKCQSACEVDEEKQDLPMVMYCLHMNYKYYDTIGFPPIKHSEEIKYTKIEMFKNIQHLIKTRLHVDCIQDDFFM